MVSNGFHMVLYDLGGGKKIRGIWDKYYAEVHACIFVVDAANQDRFEEAKAALHDAVRDPRIAGKRKRERSLRPDHFAAFFLPLLFFEIERLCATWRRRGFQTHTRLFSVRGGNVWGGKKGGERLG